MNEVSIECQTIQWLVGDAISKHKCRGFTAHRRKGMYTPEFEYNRVRLRRVIDRVRTFVDLSMLRSVCDAGSGFGQSLVGLYQNIGEYASYVGIEYNADAVTFANKMAKLANLSSNLVFKQGDVFKTDFSEYDLIYAYHPCTTYKKQLRFDRHILRTMKVGAHYLRVYKCATLEELKMPKKFKITMTYPGYGMALYRKGEVPNVAI